MPEPDSTRLRSLVDAAARAFGPNVRPSPRITLFRTLVCLLAILAISSYVGSTGRISYSALNYAVLIYAGLALPWQAVLILAATAAIGPNPHGSVFFATLQDDTTDIVRPFVIAVVATTSLALARSHRRSEDTLRASERRLFSFLDSMPLGVFVLSADGSLYYANDSARRLAGSPSGEVAAGNLSNAYNARVTGTESPYPEQRVPIVRALAGEISMVDDVEIRMGGEPVNLQMWGAPIRDESGRITHAVSAFSNITAQKRFEAALLESEVRFRTVFEEGPLGMALCGLDYRFQQVNQALCDMTGYRGDELADLTLSDITHPEDRLLMARQAGLMERGERTVIDIEKRYLRRDDETIWVRASLRLLRDALGNATCYLLMIQDITAQRLARDQIERMANYDALTGLPNRRLLYDRLSQAIARARREGRGLVVLSIDLDAFTCINDRYGHEAGDAVLIETAHRLKGCVRDTDTVARMGGDEFALLIADAEGADADRVCRRIETALVSPVTFGNEGLHIDASIGRANLFQDGDTPDSLINAADAAMHLDKMRRRLRVSR